MAAWKMVLLFCASCALAVKDADDPDQSATRKENLEEDAALADLEFSYDKDDFDDQQSEYGADDLERLAPLSKEPVRKLLCRSGTKCREDSDCKASQYCKNRNVFFLSKCCYNRKPNGYFCSRNRECAGGFCSTVRCGECQRDSDCKSGKFCRNRNLPAVVYKRCENKLSNGKLCDRNTMCISGKCVNFRCCTNCNPDSSVIKNKCIDDKDCPSNQYCKNRNIPFLANICTAKKSLGKLCSRNTECADGYCAVARCSQCIGDGHCPSGTYCKNRNLPGIPKTCAPKKCRGFCSRSAECKSGKCRFLRCKRC